MTKIEISVADIRKGDLIRVELDEGTRPLHTIINAGPTSFEYEAVFDGHGVKLAYSKHARYFLLNRPEQTFKVGTVLKGPSSGINLYIRGGDGWYVVPRTSDAFDPRKAEFSDKGARERIEQGVVKILSEPA